MRRLTEESIEYRTGVTDALLPVCGTRPGELCDAGLLVTGFPALCGETLEHPGDDVRAGVSQAGQEGKCPAHSRPLHGSC